MYQFETPTGPSPSPALRLGILVSDLHRQVRLFDAEIQTEEERSKVFDQSSATYSMLARQLRQRRDNILVTISVLKTRRSPAMA
jgi:hypothetical protein